MDASGEKLGLAERGVWVRSRVIDIFSQSYARKVKRARSRKWEV